MATTGAYRSAHLPRATRSVTVSCVWVRSRLSGGRRCARTWPRRDEALRGCFEVRVFGTLYTAVL